VTQSLFINGRFLTQSTSGVQRYAREVTSALDRALAETGQAGRAVLVAPKGAVCDLDLRAIAFETGGFGAGHLWEQGWLAWRARKGALLSLCNSGPVLHRAQAVVIHDAAVYRHPELFGANYGRLHRTLGRILARTAKLGTVSRFSRDELAGLMNTSADAILVAPNGAGHLIGGPEDLTILDKLALRDAPYFLCVGNLTRNKNVALAIDALSRLAQDGGPGRVKLVICGQANASVFGGVSIPAHDDVIFAGRVSDEALRALMHRAVALVFPSRYEGFGLPPLEAFAQQCPVIASSIPAVQEVCGDAAAYFDPDDADALARHMADYLSPDFDRPGAIRRGSARLDLFRWEKTAADLLRCVGGPN
jgi:glycosyltransferase involved in cell wall biosynthesis